MFGGALFCARTTAAVGTLRVFCPSPSALITSVSLSGATVTRSVSTLTASQAFTGRVVQLASSYLQLNIVRTMSAATKDTPCALIPTNFHTTDHSLVLAMIWLTDSLSCVQPPLSMPRHARDHGRSRFKFQCANQVAPMHACMQQCPCCI